MVNIAMESSVSPADYIISKHKCGTDPNDLVGYEGYGEAINYCYEDDENKLWVENDEYGSQVNFCPFCGYEAKIKINQK